MDSQGSDGHVGEAESKRRDELHEFVGFIRGDGPVLPEDHHCQDHFIETKNIADSHDDDVPLDLHINSNYLLLAAFLQLQLIAVNNSALYSQICCTERQKH